MKTMITIGFNDKPKEHCQQLMEKFIEARSTPWDPSIVDDPVQDRILDMIAAKKKGKSKKKTAPKAESKGPSNVSAFVSAYIAQMQSTGRELATSHRVEFERFQHWLWRLP
jgi:DNA end-binding protein Ku